MIGTTLLNWVSDFLYWIVAQFPTYSGLPSGVTSAVSYFSGKVQGLSCIIPLETVKVITLLNMALAALYLGFRFFAWVFHWRQ